VIVGDPSDPLGFPVLVARFADWMRVKNFANRTVGNRVSSSRASPCGARSEACAARPT
jgi:hypothetical protein